MPLQLTSLAASFGSFLVNEAQLMKSQVFSVLPSLHPLVSVHPLCLGEIQKHLSYHQSYSQGLAKLSSLLGKHFLPEMAVYVGILHFNVPYLVH